MHSDYFDVSAPLSSCRVFVCLVGGGLVSFVLLLGGLGPYFT